MGSSQPWSPEIGHDRAIEDEEDELEDFGPIPLGTSDFPIDDATIHAPVEYSGDEDGAGTLRDPIDEEMIVDTDEYSQRNITYSMRLNGSLSSMLTPFQDDLFAQGSENQPGTAFIEVRR